MDLYCRRCNDLLATDVEAKRCRHCLQTKPLTDFYVKTRRTIGKVQVKIYYRPECKECTIKTYHSEVKLGQPLRSP